MSELGFQHMVLSSLSFLERQTQQLFRRFDVTDQALDDLNTAEGEVNAAIDAALAEIQTLTGQLSQANASGANDPAIETIAQNLSAKATALQAALTAASTSTAGASTASSNDTTEPAPAAATEPADEPQPET